MSSWRKVGAITGAVLVIVAAMACARGTTERESEPDAAETRSEPAAGGSVPTPQSDCGDGICDVGESDVNCPQDCQAALPVCGDGQCDFGEDPTSCAQDCDTVQGSCGDLVCDPGETPQSCAQDCDPMQGSCGDLTCDAGETSQSCPQDCDPMQGGCGDLVCDPNETPQNCPQDCGSNQGGCLHDPCVEGGPLAPSCDPCVAAVCSLDPFCCQNAWDSVCTDWAAAACFCV